MVCFWLQLCSLPLVPPIGRANGASDRGEGQSPMMVPQDRAEQSWLDWELNNWHRGEGQREGRLGTGITSRGRDIAMGEGGRVLPSHLFWGIEWREDRIPLKQTVSDGLTLPQAHYLPLHTPELVTHTNTYMYAIQTIHHTHTTHTHHTHTHTHYSPRTSNNIQS